MNPSHARRKWGKGGYDFFPTPVSAVTYFLERSGFLTPEPYLVVNDPCAGQGHILAAVEEFSKGWISKPRVEGRELQPPEVFSSCAPEAEHLFQDEGVFNRYKDRIRYGVDSITSQEDFRGKVVLTNPPFNAATKIISNIMKRPPIKMAVLLPLSFMASVGRRDGLFKEHPYSDGYICSKRIDFIKGKSSDRDMVWLVWDMEPYIGHHRMREI